MCRASTSDSVHRSAQPAGADAEWPLVQTLRRCHRRLLFTSALIISIAGLATLLAIVALQVDHYRNVTLEAFQNTRQTLGEELRQQQDNHDRWVKMADYSWSQRTLRADGDALRTRYLAGGERLVLAADERSAPQMMLGLGTRNWDAAQLERYLQLSLSVSLINRLTAVDDAGDEGAILYFFDPSGHYLSLGQGITEQALKQALRVQSRDAVFAELRERAQLVRPASEEDRVPMLQGMGTRDQTRVRIGRHPVNQRPGLYSTFYVHDGEQPIAAFVAFSSSEHILGLLRGAGDAQRVLLGPDGDRLLATGNAKDGAVALDLAGLDPVDPASALPASRFVDGTLRLVGGVPGTPWLLVESHGWRAIAAGALPWLMVAALAYAILAAGLWMLAHRLGKRWLEPLYRNIAQVFDSERRLANAVSGGTTGLYVLDAATGSVVFQNNALARCTGATAQGLEALPTRLWQAFQQQGARNACCLDTEFELDLVGGEGGAQGQLLVHARMGAFDGQQRLHLALTDITARGARERQQAQALRDADAQSLAKSNFLAAMVHEIRTPLYGMLGHLELLDRSRLDSAQQNRAHRIRESADSLLGIVNDVLDLSRLEAGQMNLSTSGFDPGELVERVAMLYAPLALAKGLDLDYRIQADMPTQCQGAVDALERILRNLTSNAVKFTASGRVELRAEWLATPEGSRLKLEVADSGMGLDAWQQARLFQPFVQADDSIGERFGGSGLGLSLCRQLCDALRGSIAVDSTHGVGSVFTVEFPMAAAAGEPSASPLQGRVIGILSPSRTWRGELERRLLRWGATVRNLSVGEDVSTLDLADVDALLLFKLPMIQDRWSRQRFRRSMLKSELCTGSMS